MFFVYLVTAPYLGPFYECMGRTNLLDADKSSLQAPDLELDGALRPGRFADFLGQERLQENLGIFVQAAKGRDEPLDHLLLHGPPGLGKTTLAHIVAAEMGVDIKVTTGPILDKAATLAGLLTHLNPKDVLFIDEIHRLNPIIEEYLYSAMEDCKIDILLDAGAAARTVQLSLNPFTLIGATTRSGLLTAPLRERFGIKMRLSYYQASTLSRILQTNAKKLNIHMDVVGAEEMAKRSRGTPRIANHLLRRTRDFAQVKGKGSITKGIAQMALEALEVDQHGLDDMDNLLLHTLIDKFNGGPVGISTLATACSEESETIEEVYEPFLIQEGYIKRTPRGREATPQAYAHLQRALPQGKTAGIFDDESRSV